MCNPTKQPPRRDMYELETSLAADKGGFLLPGNGRYWAYQGTETHYGYTYHLWENEGSKRKYAWEVSQYRDALTKEKA